MDTLKKHRDLLDQLDKQIMDLLEKRFMVTKEIGDIKAREALSVENKGRESEILEKTKRYTFQNEIEALYIYLFDLSKASQRQKSS